MILLIWSPFAWSLIILVFYTGRDGIDENTVKLSALVVTVLALLLSLIVWFVFESNWKYFQFAQEQYTISHSNFYLGLDSFSVYFILLTTLTNIGEYLYNAYISNSILSTDTLYFVLLVILIPIIGFLFLALIKILDILSALLLVWVITIFTYILYIYIVYDIGDLYIVFYGVFLSYFCIYTYLLYKFQYYEFKFIIFILEKFTGIYIKYFFRTDGKLKKYHSAFTTLLTILIHTHYLILKYKTKLPFSYILWLNLYLVLFFLHINYNF